MSTHKRAKEIKKQIEQKNVESIFWSIFDAYLAVVSTPAWDEAVEKLPADIQKIVDEKGLDSCLDWDYWGNPSFFGLTFDSESPLVDVFYEEDTEGYVEFLNRIETAMMDVVRENEDFEAFEIAIGVRG